MHADPMHVDIISYANLTSKEATEIENVTESFEWKEFVCKLLGRYE